MFRLEKDYVLKAFTSTTPKPRGYIEIALKKIQISQQPFHRSFWKTLIFFVNSPPSAPFHLRLDFLSTFSGVILYKLLTGRLPKQNWFKNFAFSDGKI